MISRRFLGFIMCSLVAASALCAPACAEEGLAERGDIVQTVFVPTSGWLVGPASISSAPEFKGAQMPCVMVNQFDNGYVVRLSGGGGKLMALAVDFRQSAFTPRTRYDVVLSLPQGFSAPLAGQAHDASTLIFNLQKQDGLYDRLASAPEMVLTLGQNALRFSLAGAKDGLDRIESCFAARSDAAPRATAALPDVRSAAAPAKESAPNPAGMNVLPQVPFLGGMKNVAQQTADAPAKAAPDATQDEGPLSIDATLKFAADRVLDVDAAEGEGAAPVKRDAVPAPKAPAPQATQASAPFVPPQESQDEKGGIWRAAKGEDVRKVLQRWADEEGVELVWTARGEARVPQDFGFEGEFSDAVAAFLKDAGRDTDLHGQFAESGPEDGAARTMMAAVSTESRSESGGRKAAAESRWRALRGTDLRNVLELWTRSNGIDLVWQSPASFAVAESLSLQGGFAEAVGALLTQYEGADMRPVGKIYRNPETGRDTLVIDLQRES